jgi:phage gp45-like
VNLDSLNRWIAPLRNRVLNLVARAVVKLADDGKALQELQLSVLAGEVRDGVERFQNYGFTSVPKDGAEAIVIAVGGRREHLLAIAVDDRRYRESDLESGEVAIYNHTGAKIVMKANGDIEATPKAGQKFKVVGDAEVSGTLTAQTDVVGGGKSLKNHTHSLGLPATVSITTTNAIVGSPSTATSALGQVSGSTAAPS